MELTEYSLQFNEPDETGFSSSDAQCETTQPVSIASGGTQGLTAGGAQSVSAGGRFVAFTNPSANLVSGDANDTSDVFVAVVTGDNEAPAFWIRGGGKVTTDFGNNHDAGYDVTVQVDGKTLVAGQSANGTSADFALARYNANGRLDSGFG